MTRASFIIRSFILSPPFRLFTVKLLCGGVKEVYPVIIIPCCLIVVNKMRKYY